MVVRSEEKPITGQIGNWLRTGEASPSLIRIVVADEQRLFRECIASILARGPGLEIVGIAGEGLEALELVRDLHPDLILLDLKIAHPDGIEVLQRLRTEFPLLRVIVLTTHFTDRSILQALQAGASGYILKDISVAGLVAAIHAVYNGEQVTDPLITKRMMRILEMQQAGQSEDCDGLTARERETLVLVGKGMVAKEIALVLAISEKTVRNHISGIYRKLNIYDRSQVVIYALKKGLIVIED